MLVKGNAEVTVTLPSNREIVFIRIFGRRPDLLFKAWTQPEHLRHWWGCDGSRLTVCDVDLVVGGEWHIVMRMADGSDHPFRGVYREIVTSKRLVYTECYDVPRLGSPEWLTTVTFDDLRGSTRLTHAILHGSREARDGHLQAGMEAGSIQTLRRLDEYTARSSEGTFHRSPGQL